jgi:hypothetical protein
MATMDDQARRDAMEWADTVEAEIIEAARQEASHSKTTFGHDAPASDRAYWLRRAKFEPAPIWWSNVEDVNFDRARTAATCAFRAVPGLREE